MDTTHLLNILKMQKFNLHASYALEYEDAHLQLLPEKLSAPRIEELVHMENVLVTPHIARTNF